jgi:uncharacterized protein
MKVTVAYAAPGVEAIVDVTLRDGATIADAIAESGLVARLQLPATIAFAIYGQRAAPDTPVVDGDRVEITRLLVADPKAVRRARAVDKPLPRTGKVKQR